MLYVVLFFYSFVRSALGAILLTLSDNMQAIMKEMIINPIPEPMIKPTGKVKLHLTIPMLPRKIERMGLIRKLPIVIPTTVEIIIAGIKDNAVWRTNCLVVNPKAL